MGSERWWLPLVLLSWAASLAGAEAQYTLRMATSAPDGTGWARELRGFSADVERRTHGDVRVKWYFGGVAGEENEVLARIEKGQLDGSASGGILCERLSPSIRVVALPGVFQNRDEAAFVLHQLRASAMQEVRQAGFNLLLTTGMGSVVFFSRKPIASMEELRRTKLWIWDLDTDGVLVAREMGMTVVPSSLSKAAQAYESGRIDAFDAIPAAALAFQWSSKVSYLTNLHTRYLTGCMIVSNGAFDRLPTEHQEAMRAAAAKFDVRVEEVNRRMDDALLGGVFERQGLHVVDVADTFRLQFFEAARSTRERLGSRLVPTELMNRALEMLADYRAQRAAQ